MPRSTPISRRTAFAAALAMARTAIGGEPPGYAREVPETRSGPPVFAFNGKDLSGFYTFLRYRKYDDPYRVVSVVDGMVRVSGAEVGGFATRESFANYHLIVEWKWGGPTCKPRRWRARNSGVMVHASGPDGEALASWMESVECQIIEGGCGDLVLVPARGKTPPSMTADIRLGVDGQPYYRKGEKTQTRTGGRINWWGRDPGWRDILWFRGTDDVDRPVGEWNRMEIVCDGDAIAVVLNGVLVNAGTKSSLTSGKILLQSEGAEIWFRKIEVRPLLK